MGCYKFRRCRSFGTKCRRAVAVACTWTLVLEHSWQRIDIIRIGIVLACEKFPTIATHCNLPIPHPRHGSSAHIGGTGRKLSTNDERETVSRRACGTYRHNVHAQDIFVTERVAIRRNEGTKERAHGFRYYFRAKVKTRVARRDQSIVLALVWGKVSQPGFFRIFSTPSCSDF